MTGVEEDYTRMFSAVKDRFILAPTGLLASLPGVPILVDQYYDVMDSLVESGAIQSTDISGATASKEEKKEIMINKVEFIARTGKSLAVTLEDLDLEREMSWTPVQLRRLPNTTCANTCKRILDLIEPFLTDLVDYGITALVISSGRTSVDDFRTAIPKPRTKIIDRSLSTKEISVLIRRGIRILKKLDAKFGPLEENVPTFHSGYLASRKVIDTGTRTLALRGTVVDVNGVPMWKVKITFEGLRLVKRTTEKGNFQVKHLLEGPYRIICSLPGFVDVEKDIYIIDGRRFDLEVVMEAIG